jgi:4-carboxymuconolactone decarboxylase
MNENERYQAGLKVRREVLGDTHVQRSLDARTDFTSEFQEFITRTAWGTVWTRDGLPRHTRSLLTIAMMVALGHDEEFKLHIRAARNNGVTAEEIKEVLLQSAIYCGVPAANHAFALAKPILEEQAAEG